MRVQHVRAAVTVFIFLFLLLPAAGYCQASPDYNDESIPKVIQAVSPCVVGVIGNHKAASYSSYNNKYSEDVIHGTGVIIKSNGEILTNAHVVNEMDKILVILADGSGYEATLKCIDEESDLATLKIKKTGLPTANLGSEKDVVIGKTVIAIGNPISLSLRNSASIGIISGIGRSINSSYRLLQTDAAINPGNSGGPLVNLKGEVIGINSSKFFGEGIEGIGFSIPIDTVSYVIGQFDKFGRVMRPSLGALFEEGWAAKLGLPSMEGIRVMSVDIGSSAEKADLRENDILYELNGVKINSIVDLNEALKKYLPGANIDLKIKRGDVLLSVKITLGELK